MFNVAVGCLDYLLAN